MAIETELDPSKSTFILDVGKKGMGKSENAAHYYRTFPFDRLVIDFTGDIAAGPLGQEPGTIVIRGEEAPSRWPDPPWDAERASVIYVPDTSQKNHRDECDRWIGLAFAKGHVLIWIDELHQLAAVHQTFPHTYRALSQGRHRDLVLLMCDPRTVGLEYLVLHNADIINVYRLPQKADRLRICEVVGLDEGETATFMAEAPKLKPFYFIRVDPNADPPEDPTAESDRLVLMPPIPFKVPQAKKELGAA